MAPLLLPHDVPDVPDGLGVGVLKGVILWARLEGIMSLGPHEAL